MKTRSSIAPGTNCANIWLAAPRRNRRKNLAALPRISTTASNEVKSKVSTALLGKENVSDGTRIVDIPALQRRTSAVIHHGRLPSPDRSESSKCSHSDDEVHCQTLPYKRTHSSRAQQASSRPYPSPIHSPVSDGGYEYAYRNSPLVFEQHQTSLSISNTDLQSSNIHDSPRKHKLNTTREPVSPPLSSPLVTVPPQPEAEANKSSSSTIRELLSAVKIPLPPLGSPPRSLPTPHSAVDAPITHKETGSSSFAEQCSPVVASDSPFLLRRDVSKMRQTNGFPRAHLNSSSSSSLTRTSPQLPLAMEENVSLSSWVLHRSEMEKAADRESCASAVALHLKRMEFAAGSDFSAADNVDLTHLDNDNYDNDYADWDEFGIPPSWGGLRMAHSRLLKRSRTRLSFTRQFCGNSTQQEINRDAAAASKGSPYIHYELAAD